MKFVKKMFSSRAGILYFLCLAVLLTTLLAGGTFAVSRVVRRAVNNPQRKIATQSATKVTGYIGEEKAKAIALEHSGESVADVTFTKAGLEQDDMLYIYDVEFYTLAKEYEYEINATTGAIVEFDVDNNEGTAPVESPLPTQPAAAEYIGEAAAKEIALTHAGVVAANATFTKVKLERDDRIYIYDIEFFSGQKEYEYELDAVSGAIIEFDVDIHDGNSTVPSTPAPTAPSTPAPTAPSTPAPTAPATPAPTDGYISAERAKEIALTHAGVSASNASFTKVKFERDNGIYIYDVEFYVGSMEYEYEINATTGAIIEHSVEREDDTHDAEPTPAPTDAPAQYITADAAKQIALKHAGYTEGQVRFTKVEFDRDDSMYVYEIEFTVNGYEYEYEINAITGDILDYDYERDD